MKYKWNVKCKTYIACDIKDTYVMAVFREEDDAKLCAKFFNEYAEQTQSNNWYSVEKEIDFFASEGASDEEDLQDWEDEEKSFWEGEENEEYWEGDEE